MAACKDAARRLRDGESSAFLDHAAAADLERLHRRRALLEGGGGGGEENGAEELHGGVPAWVVLRIE